MLATGRGDDSSAWRSYLTNSIEETSMSSRKHVLTAAALRGKGKFAEAIAEIEDNIKSFDEETMVPALLEALYAAKEAGDVKKARELAQQLAIHDPDIPSIKEFLS